MRRAPSRGPSKGSYPDLDVMDMYVTTSRIFIKPTESVFRVYLVFNRDTEGVKVKQQNRISRHSVKKQIFGVIGIIKLILCRYLIVVSKRTRVDAIRKRRHSLSDVWRIDKVNLVPLSPGKRSLSRRQKEMNEEFISMVLSALNSGDFYYSSSYRLSVPVMKAQTVTPEDDGYIWNNYLLEELDKIDGADLYCVKIINGFVGVQYVACQAEEVVVALVSRRRNKRVGTRYFCRGCDPNGEVANFVETEVIVEWINRKCSFLILRGSAPVMWDQWPDFSFNPRPVLSRAETQYPAFNRHFEWLENRYGQQALIDLCQYTTHGDKIHELCKSAALSAGDLRIAYCDLDVEKTVKKREPEFPEEIRKCLKDMGFTFALNDAILYQQKGTFRISSLDCSDYTNVIQALIVSTIMSTLLQTALGPDVYKTPRPAELKSMKENINELWLKQGDTLSKHYTGTRAEMAKLLSPVKKEKYEYCYNWLLPYKRWYENNFEDGFKQDSLDLILGHYRVDPKNPLPRPHVLVNILVDYMPPGIITFATIQVIRFATEYYDGYKYEDEGKCVFTWTLMVMILWMWFYGRLGHYTNQPQLVVKKPWH